MSKLRPTPPPRKKKEKPVPPPRNRKEKSIPSPRERKGKPVPPSRTKDVKPVPPPKECEHGSTEEIDGVTFCIHCGLEIDHNPLRRGLLREGQAFCASRKKDPMFKRRPGSKKPEKEYIPVSPSEAPLLVRKDQILRTRF